MYNNAKKVLIPTAIMLYLILQPILGLAVKPVFGCKTTSITSLPSNTLTVGCARKGCVLLGGNGLLMYGFYDEAARMLEELGATYPMDEKIRPIFQAALHAPIHKLWEKSDASNNHNHPGLTVDITPRHMDAQGEHTQGDFFQLSFPEKTYDAVFFEQFPPTGMMPKNAKYQLDQESPDILPRAIEKGRTLLTDHGIIVLELALDYFIDSKATKEELARLRDVNPFMGYFNDYSRTVHQKIQEDQLEGDDTLSQLFQFYKTKVLQKIQQLIDVTEPVSGDIAPIVKTVLESSFGALLKLKETPLSDWQFKTNKSGTIPDTVAKLMVPFRQGDMMVNYMNSHGFKDAKLEWLEADEHQFNTAAGWFLTAIKDLTYQRNMNETATSTMSARSNQ